MWRERRERDRGLRLTADASLDSTRWGAVAALGGEPRDYRAHQHLRLSLDWLKRV